MYTYYQPWLLPFLKFRPNIFPAHLKQLYYYSFEDGLWDILRHHFPGQKVNFLVPDFYCSDVLDNIRKHGHDYIYYHLDKDFQISPSSFQKYLWLYKPDIIIIFHACGITSDLIIDTSWISELPSQSLIIEDSVHCLVDPQKIKLINSRHLVMDSLRKVSPLPGSRLIGSPEILNFSPSRIYNLYFFKSLLYYLLFRFFQKLGLVTWSHHYLLSLHDDLIGDEYVSQKGLTLFSPLIRHLNYDLVTRTKTFQVNLYERYLKPIFKNHLFYHIKLSPTDYSHLHVYPLGINNDPQNTLEKWLNKHGFPVWYKFTDSPWSETRRVLFLPLGLHISETSIKNLSKVLQSI